MCCPLRLTTWLRVFCLSRHWVYSLSVSSCSRTVVVALLGTSHDVDVVLAEGVHILCVGITHDIVFPIADTLFLTIIVI